ncbi:hypothetical protein EXIGLDRAFT_718615 [Exidia glandulosa HHB12029]|uniref:F-box domain-containing protein n=1 Tax=Exidia glandulosa HHB12029 TaxID=1314781 RepID=A0A165HNM1_EXIGL|nr:hypothetical protein EXIGLDRAFT_718615 [Exidia glandulosa HHB12029]
MTRHFGDLNADVLAIICNALHDVEQGPKNLRAFSLTNRRIRHASLPPLFRSVSVHKKTLRDSADALVALKETNSVTRYIRVFTFSLEVPSFQAVQEFWTTRDPAALMQGPEDAPDCASAFAEALASMPYLRSLTFQPNRNLLEVILQHFPVAFASSQLQLGRVESLSTDVSLTFLRGICPSAVALSLRMSAMSMGPDCGQEWAAGGRVTKLDILDMGHGDEMEDFVKYLPHITELAIESRYFDVKLDLARLASLQSLTSLHLPPLSSLNLGYNPPWCGNAYMGPNGQKLRERLNKQEEEAKRQAKRIVRDALPRLRFLRIDYVGTYNFSTLKTDDPDELDRLAAIEDS